MLAAHSGKGRPIAPWGTVGRAAPSSRAHSVTALAIAFDIRSLFKFGPTCSLDLCRLDPMAGCSYIAASRTGRRGVALTSSFLRSCSAAKIIARSARAVIVKSGLTPTAEGTAAPSHT